MFLRLLLLLSIPLMGWANNYGARTISMGSSSTCLNDVWSTFNNPSALIFTNGINVGLNYENRFLLNQLSERSIAASSKLHKQVFGVGVSQFGYSAYNLLQGRFSYARLLFENFSLGLSINYWQLHLADIYGNKRTLTGDIGFTWKSSEKLQLGFVLSNPTSNKLSTYNNERLPTNAKFGLSYLFSKKVLGCIETEKSTSEKFILKSGLEYKPNDHLSFRLGYQSNSKLLCFGFGYKINSLIVDLGSSYHQQLGYIINAGVTVSFIQKQNE